MILLLGALSIASKASAALTIVSESGSTMYTDFANGLDSTYLVFQITNDATTYTDVWAQLDTHGGNIANAGTGIHEIKYAPGGNGAPPVAELGFPSADETKGVFFMVTAGTTSSTSQTLTVNLYDANPVPGPANLLATQDFSFTVAGSIQANANKVTTIVAVPSNPTPGELGTVTVTGNTGITKGGILYFTPVSASSWLPDTFEFVDSDINITGYANNDYKNIALIPSADVLKTGSNYTEVFTFVIDGFGTATTSTANFISSGGNVKHTVGTQATVTATPPSADITLLKTQTSPDPANNPVLGGTNVTYHIVATNTGPDAATNVMIGDSITGGTFFSFANPTSNLDCFTTPPTALPFTCTAASMAVNDTASFDVTVTMPNDGTTSVTNTATQTAGSPTDTGNPNSPVITTICPTVDISVVKTTTDLSHGAISTIKGGSDFLYHIVVANGPGLPATNVLFTDTLPPGVTYVSDTASCASGTIATNNCNLGTIAASASVAFDIRVTAIDAGMISNTANVAEDQCDSNPTNNMSTVQITVETNNMPTALEADREANPASDPDGVPVTTTNVPDSTLNRVIEPNELVRIDPAWTNTLDNATPTDVTGSVPTSGAGSYGNSDTTANGVTYEVDDPTADYGIIPAHAQSDCNAAVNSSNSSIVGDCYEMRANQPGVRPVQHWDTHFTETLSTGETHTWTLHLGDSFNDVPRSDPFYRFIETIFHHAITVGCQPSSADNFCPLNNATRGESAAFISRAIYGNDSAVPTSGTGWDCTTTSFFADSFNNPTNQFYCRYANALHDIHIVNGCDGVPDYCFTADVTRGDFAVIAARGVSYLPPNNNTSDPDGGIPLFGNDAADTRQFNCDSVDHIDTVSSANIPAGTAPFADVPCSNPEAKQIGYLWLNHTIDGDCAACDGTAHYRPFDLILRDELAKIISNAFVALPLYGP